mgnify:CR=1 FL=1
MESTPQPCQRVEINLAINCTKEVQWHGKLEQQSVDEDEVTNRHRPCHNAFGSKVHYTCDDNMIKQPGAMSTRLCKLQHAQLHAHQ